MTKNGNWSWFAIYLYCVEVCVNDASLQTLRQRGKTLLTTLWGRKVWLCLASVQPQLTGGAVQANMKKINWLIGANLGQLWWPREMWPWVKEYGENNVSNLDFILTDWKIGTFCQARSKLLLPDRFRARVETMWSAFIPATRRAPGKEYFVSRQSL